MKKRRFSFTTTLHVKKHEGVAFVTSQRAITLDDHQGFVDFWHMRIRVVGLSFLDVDQSIKSSCNYESLYFHNP